MSDLLQEIKDYLDSIENNSVRASIARDVNEYEVCKKTVIDCKEAVLSLFKKLDREYWELLERFGQAQERIAELEMKYENTGAVFNRQYMQEKIERYEKAIKETLEILKRGGPGTRSQVQALLEKALEGEE